MENKHDESPQMSGPEIIEAVDTASNKLISADEEMGPDKEQKEIDVSPTMARTLVEVEELVDELRTRSRELPDDTRWLNPYREEPLPRRLYPRMRTLLSRQGLEELPSGRRQEARLRILAAIGLCQQKASRIGFIDTYVVGDSDLSFSELEALYRRRPESSTALKELYITIPANASEHWAPESWRLLTEILLGTQSLETVVLEDLPLPELSQLAKAVAASSRGSVPFREVVILHGFENLYRFRGPAGSLIEEWAGNVANFNLAAPNLKELTIKFGRFADEDVAELIGGFVAAVNGHTSRQSTERTRLTIAFLEGADSPFTEQEYRRGVAAGQTLLQDADADACKSEGPGTGVATVSAGKRRMGSLGRLLTTAFLRFPRGMFFDSLALKFDEETASFKAGLEVLSKVLQMDSHVTEFRFGGFYIFESRNLRGIVKSLQLTGAHIQSLVLQNIVFDPDSFAMFVEMLKFRSLHGLSHLTLKVSKGEGYLDWPGFYTSLSQMESVSLSEHVGQPQAERELCEWIQGSKALLKLKLGKGRGVNWRSIFACLRENQSVTSLEVRDESLFDEDTYRELMEMLQVNSTLQRVEFTGGDGSRQAAVREALKCKARQESYLAELRRGLGHGKAKWGSPKCGRVFLCGSPEAGKTRLTRTMLKKSVFKRLKEKLLRRTEGVEIHTLTNDDYRDMQIRVWDLAGQNIFRVLQQFLFPRFSRACVFIFVFSPFMPMPQAPRGERILKPQLEEAFSNELLEWLRFIVSNSAVTGFNRPEVMVVISHKDMFKFPEIGLKWHDTVLTRFISEFEGAVHIHPARYFIDGHESEHVKPIVDKVFSIFSQLFQEKLFHVPIACSDMSQHLVEWVSQNPKEPIIDDLRFFALCRDIHDLRTFSEECDEENNKRLLKAVGSYLHDVGTVINMASEEDTVEKRGKPRSSLMVVNPNWLTHVFLGRFISIRYEFQLEPQEIVEWARSVDGFLCESDFQHLLFKCFLEPMKKEFPKLTWDTLQDLMENLDLLYVTEAVN